MPKLGLGLSLPINSGLNSVIFQNGFWTNFSSTIGKIITGFNSTFTASLTVNWGDGTTTPLTSGVNVNKTLGTTNAIKLETNNAVVTRINCGGSLPRLGGTVDISSFPYLVEFRCNSNDITALSGYAENINLIDVQFNNNKVIDPLPSLNSLINLQHFSCYSNQLTGSIPSLSNLTDLRVFECDRNQLTGSIPSLSGLTNLQYFYCYENQLTGSIPSLDGLTDLRFFYCYKNQLTGSIPSLSSLTNLQYFYCYDNQLTAFEGGSVSNTLGYFQAQNNQLTSTAVNAILTALVAANKTTGTRFLNLGGTGNAAPTGQGITDKATLVSRGWTVTTN